MEFLRLKFSHINYRSLGVTLAVFIVVGLSFFEQIHFMVTDWFVEDGYSKGPIIWFAAIGFMYFSLTDGRQFAQFSTRLQLLYLAILIVLIIIIKKPLPDIVPILVICGSWFFLASRQHTALIVTMFFLLTFSLSYYPMLTPVLQSVAVVAIENLLRIFDIPVLVQQFYIAIPKGQIFIADSCSGARYLANNLILMFLYSLASRFNLRQFGVVLIATVSLSLVMNWTRILLIVLAAHTNGFDHDLVQDHGNMGWYLYAAFLVPYFYVLQKIDRSMKLKLSISGQNSSKPLLKLPSGWLGLPLLAVGLF